MLLAAAVNDRADLYIFTDVLCTHALRSVDLVTADGAHIYLQFLRVDLIFSKSLYRIDME